MKLYRLRYSPYARKVQMLLDLLGHRYELIETPYTDRNELATLTGGYIYVPVLVDDAGRVLCESRVICEALLREAPGNALLPSPLQGPIWAYHDFVDGPLEDILFRIASPGVRDAWATPFERALYVLTKERKFGAGCVDAWQREQPALAPLLFAGPGREAAAHGRALALEIEQRRAHPAQGLLAEQGAERLGQRPRAHGPERAQPAAHQLAHRVFWRQARRQRRGQREPRLER